LHHLSPAYGHKDARYTGGCQHTRNMPALTKAYSLKLVLRISSTPKTRDRKTMYTANESPKTSIISVRLCKWRNRDFCKLRICIMDQNAVNRKFDPITLTLTLLDPPNLLSRKKWVMLLSCIINAIHIFI